MGTRRLATQYWYDGVVGSSETFSLLEHHSLPVGDTGGREPKKLTWGPIAGRWHSAKGSTQGRASTGTPTRGCYKACNTLHSSRASGWRSTFLDGLAIIDCAPAAFTTTLSAALEHRIVANRCFSLSFLASPAGPLGPFRATHRQHATGPESLRAASREAAEEGHAALELPHVCFATHITPLHALFGERACRINLIRTRAPLPNQRRPVLRPSEAETSARVVVRLGVQRWRRHGRKDCAEGCPRHRGR